MQSEVINVAALVASFFSLGVTALIASRQLRIAQSANRLPVIMDHFYRVRSLSFREREERLWSELGGLDLGDGFASLPPDLRESAWEVALYYQHLAYLVAFEVIDRDMALVPVHYHLLKSWEALEVLIYCEREKRGDTGVLLLRAFERLAERARRVDAFELSERMGRQLLNGR
jgi:hypothetical protein